METRIRQTRHGAVSLLFFVLAGPLAANSQEIVEPIEFKEVIYSERQVSAEHLVVGVIADERRRSALSRPEAIYLREFNRTILGELCGEFRSLDGLFYGEMRYPALANGNDQDAIWLGYPSQKKDVFDYPNTDVAVRLSLCAETDIPVYHVSSWLGLVRDEFLGAEILLNTQSGTDVFAYLGTEALPCTQEPEGNRGEVDFRCFISADQIDVSIPISLIVDRTGSRDAVVQLLVTR